MAFAEVGSFEALARATAPALVRDQRLASWRPGSGLSGTVFWGALGLEDMTTAIQRWSFDLARRARAFATILDIRRVLSIDEAAFGAAARFVTEHREALAVRVTRQAIVCAPGLPGAVFAGFVRLFPAGHPAEVFDALGPALEWCGRVPELAIELDSIVERGRRGAIDGLRAWLLSTALDQVSLSRAARSLSTTPRTLQRVLREAGTTFRDELRRARLERAKALLVDGDQKIASVADQVGFASEQHFARTFAVHVGELPSTFRRRRARAS